MQVTVAGIVIQQRGDLDLGDLGGGRFGQGPLRILKFAEKSPVLRTHRLKLVLEFEVQARGYLRSGRHGLLVAGADILEFPRQLLSLGADLVLFLRGICWSSLRRFRRACRSELTTSFI